MLIIESRMSINILRMQFNFFLTHVLFGIHSWSHTKCKYSIKVSNRIWHVYIIKLQSIQFHSIHVPKTCWAHVDTIFKLYFLIRYLKSSEKKIRGCEGVHLYCNTSKFKLWHSWRSTDSSTLWASNLNFEALIGSIVYQLWEDCN